MFQSGPIVERVMKSKAIRRRLSQLKPNGSKETASGSSQQSTNCWLHSTLISAPVNPILAFGPGSAPQQWWMSFCEPMTGSRKLDASQQITCNQSINTDACSNGYANRCAQFVPMCIPNYRHHFARTMAFVKRSQLRSETNNFATRSQSSRSANVILHIASSRACIDSTYWIMIEMRRIRPVFQQVQCAMRATCD